MARKILATAALPYANGEIHLGHLVEYLQTDYWTRFQKMRGHECLYICADDTHGAPIMLKARQRGITPEQLIEESYQKHLKDFSDFEIEFDYYSSTNSPENREMSESIFAHMKEKGHIAIRPIEQTYCEHDKMFLPDRFVKGTCPRCHAKDQYGDSCDVCSATYGTTELKDAYCAICNNPPVQRESEHIFFQLNHFQSFLKEWVPQHTQKEINNKLQEWLAEDLRDWDISRDDPYFGFEIPGFPGKYFYVWVDAPVGYISSTKKWCEQEGRDYSEFWKASDAEIYHFIGKDIVYFHTLFWPAMLHNAGLKTPDQVFVHGFLTVNGEKMSKSRGTFVNARTYLNHLNPSYLRYYYACKLSAAADDLDLNIDDFVNRVNSDLVGKITNLASRGAQMLTKKLDGVMGTIPNDAQALIKSAQEKSEKVADFYEKREFAKAMVEIRTIADEANRYFDEREPWKLIKTDPERTKGILTAILNLFRMMSIYLKPVLPSYVKNVEKLLNESPYNWESASKVLENQKIEPYEHLMKRVEGAQFEKVIEETKGSLEKAKG